MNNNITIAIIDDDLIDRTVIRRLVSSVSKTIEFLEFDSGMEALSYLTNNAMQSRNIPDIILLDVRMPVMDGWEYLAEYHKIEAQLIKKPRYYIYTSSINPRDLHLQAGIHGNLTKPVGKEDIIRIITELQ